MLSTEERTRLELWSVGEEQMVVFEQRTVTSIEETKRLKSSANSAAEGLRQRLIAATCSAAREYCKISD